MQERYILKLVANDFYAFITYILHLVYDLHFY